MTIRMRTAMALVCSTASLIMAPAVSGAEAYQWKNVAMGGTGYVTGLLAHPTAKNLFYARTDVGGAYRWNETKAGWDPLFDWINEDQTGYSGVESMALDPSNPDVVYAFVGTSYWAGGAAILRSADRGNTWKAFTTYTNGTATLPTTDKQFWANGNAPSGRGSGEKLAVDPRNGNIVFVGTRRDGLFRSANAGANWKYVTGLPVSATPDGNGISFVAFVPGNEAQGTASRTIYVGISRTGEANLYKSTDGGTSWNAVANAPTSAQPFRAQVSGSNLYVTYMKPAAAPGGLGVLVFNTSNGSYRDITPSNATCYACYADAVSNTGAVTDAVSYGGIQVDPNNPSRLVLSSRGTYTNQQGTAATRMGWGDYVLVSVDGGASWKKALDNRSEYSTNGMPFAAGHALHWASSVLLDPFNPKRLFAVSGHGILGTDSLTDGSTATPWKFQSRGIEEGVFLDAVSLANGRLVSTMLDYDGFTHIDPALYADSVRALGGTATSLATAERAPNKVVKAHSRLLWSEDSGTTWVEIPRPTANAANGTVALSAKGSTLLYRPAGSLVFWTTRDKGATWTQASGLSFTAARSNYYSFKVFADGADDTLFYYYDRNNTAEGSGGYMWIGKVGSNGVLNFTRGGYVKANAGEIPRSVPGRAGHVYVPLGGSGMMYSSDGGKTFNVLASVSRAAAVSFGPPAECSSYPSMFIWGVPSAVKAANDAQGVASRSGMYRSYDQGSTWLRVNADESQFGNLANGAFIVADKRVFGRVYRSTAGRGIAYGEIIPGSIPQRVLTCASQSSVAKGGVNVISAWVQGAAQRTSKLSFELDGATKASNTVNGDQLFSWQLSSLTPGNYRVRSSATDVAGAVSVGAWRYFDFASTKHQLKVNNPWLNNGNLTFMLPSDFVAGTPVALQLNGNGVSRSFGTDTPARAGINYARIQLGKYLSPGTYTITLSVAGSVVDTIKATKYAN